MVSTLASTIGQFNMDNIRLLQELGYEVDVAADHKDESAWPAEKTERFRHELADMGAGSIQIDFSRSPLNVSQHIRAYRQMLELLRTGHYSLMHTHTPIASAIARLAARKYNRRSEKEKVRVIYTAHGFHFYKGAPLINWLVFYPVERMLSRYTDVLITINREDYKRAKKSFRAGKTRYVPGIGIDLENYRDAGMDDPGDGDDRDRFSCDKLRTELGVKPDEVMLLSVGELCENKNHLAVIKALATIPDERIKYFIAGTGVLEDWLKATIKEYGLERRVKLLGYRNDVAKLLNAADMFVFPSIREGLSVSLMEAIASKTPVICGRIRGNVDLVRNRESLFDPVDEAEIAEVIKRKVGLSIKYTGKADSEEANLRIRLQRATASETEENYEHLKHFSIEEVRRRMAVIYKNGGI